MSLFFLALALTWTIFADAEDPQGDLPKPLAHMCALSTIME